ncbi:MAG TPA: rod shape-determining protein RodA [Bacteroidota bacterium]|nr:rod shape-determining protein RodA [Bacteroidota bacterium]
MMDNWIKENFDITTLLVVLSLILMGFTAVYSATYDAGASTFFHRQLFFAGIGVIIMVLTVIIPFRTLQLFSYPLYGISLIILVMVLFTGKVIAGSKSWFGIQGLGLQPSEIVKVTTILALASYLSNPRINLSKLKYLLTSFIFVLIPVSLILLQPDVGTALIYLGTLLLVLYWAGISKFALLTLLAPAASAVAALFGITAFAIVIAATLIILFLLRENRLLSAIVFSITVVVGVSVQFIFSRFEPYQQKRILTFLNPDADPLGAGYNVIQSKIAIGSGGFFGKGYLQGSQTQLNFIPAQWTDFIFCVPGEEFGFVGALIILLFFVILLYRGIKIASIVKNRYASLVAIGIVSSYAVHITINIGMSMGIMPVIGVPLPFLSYGGSNLITNITMAGLLLNMYVNRKEY